MSELHKVNARLVPIKRERPPLFSKWNPSIDPPPNGVHKYWSHFPVGDGLWTLWIESPEQVGEINHELKDAYLVTVHFAMPDAPHHLLQPGCKFTLTVGHWKKAELEVLQTNN